MSQREIFEEVAVLLASGYLRLKRRSPEEAGALGPAAAATGTSPEISSGTRAEGLDVHRK
jgi:hypothetical protein